MTIKLVIVSSIALLLCERQSFAQTCENLCDTHNNTAYGNDALGSLTTGQGNTAIGAFALLFNDTNSNNVAIGYNALYYNKADNNTAIGVNAMVANRTGSGNTATGFEALYVNTSGTNNTATGINALQGNFNGNTGSYNTATGGFTLSANIDGSNNTATGIAALGSNTHGDSNTGTGQDALLRNTTGSLNTAEGSEALAFNTTGSNNVAVGFSAGNKLTTGSNNIDIGANVLGVAGEANTIRIGKSGTQQKTFIAGISGKTVASGVGVIINSTGQLGTVQSSARFKQDIKPMDKASEALLKLKPVTFRYKEELDPDKIPQFGLIAEEVEKVDPDLVVRDENGKVTTVRYEAVNAMLLNEFLKAHRKAEELTSELNAERKESQAKFSQQQKQIEALGAGLEKVSAQLQASQATLVAGN
jgi:Chaperone of endosialidase